MSIDLGLDNLGLDNLATITFKDDLGSYIINASLNIMRKYLKEKCIPKAITWWRDNGVVAPPERIRVA